MSKPTSQLPFLEIIEWVEQDPNLMMWKIPDGDKEIKNGAKLIVRESQSALLLNEGTVADVFTAGTHSLETKNIPVLSRLKGWKYGFESPFKADVYFFAVRQFINLKWGTPAPVVLRDPQFGQVRVRAFGTYNVRISDIPRFFKEYAGTYPRLSIFEFEQQLRDFIAPKFGEVLATANISVLDIAGSLTTLNERIAPLIKPYFDDFGIGVTQFTITSATLPEEVTQFYDKVTGMNMVGDMTRFQQFNTAIAISQEGNPAQSGTQQGLAMGLMMGQLNNAQEPGSAGQQQATPAGGDLTAKLQQLKTLFEGGLIDEEEYKVKKAGLLAQL
ncbi:SPFH domain-containing protein [Niabella beijingensis]|uniref:SPFH domain-containing protein n=1 Tax=Niabella beijingensis TaxID=2872700 RepID=UPI001CBDA188|nr:SPFH domain-containing protein [Niabella beijingensis]MBZ4192676.1 SPFH domain-containing protein [Niabella beijingensis]